LIAAGPSRLALIVGALAFAALATGGCTVALASTRALVRGWGTDHVPVGAGAVFALPFMALFILALSLGVARAVPGRQSPSMYLGPWTMRLGGVALASVIGASIAGAVLSDRLRGAGYVSCRGGFTGRLGIVHWVRGGAACPSGDAR